MDEVLWAGWVTNIATKAKQYVAGCWGNKKLRCRRQAARCICSWSLKCSSGVIQGHWRWHHSLDHTRLTIYCLPLWVYLYLVQFLSYLTLKISWPWILSWRSVKVIENSIIQKLGYTVSCSHSLAAWPHV